MDDIDIFFKKVLVGITNVGQKILKSQVVQAIKCIVYKDSFVNITLEIMALCSLYTFAIAMNSSSDFIIIENILLCMSYISAYYLLPKRSFEYKSFVNCLCAVLLASPAIIFLHTDLFSIYEFLSLSVIILWTLFQVDRDNFKKIPAIVIDEVSVSCDEIKKLNEKFVVKSVVTEQECFDEYNVFHNLNDLKNWLDKTKMLPFFKNPSQIIYYHNSDFASAVHVLQFASEYGLSVFDKEHKPIKFENFMKKSSLSNDEISDLKAIFARSTIIVEYTGNPILNQFIGILAEVKSSNIIISCTNDRDLADLMQFKNRANISFHMSSVLTVIENQDKVDYVFASSRSFPLDLNIDKQCAIYNVKHYNDVIRICANKKVKELYLISNSDSMYLSTVSGLAQRWAELYAQNASISNDMCIIPIRFPKTIFDPLALIDQIKMKMRDSNDIEIDNTTYYVDNAVACDTFVRFLNYSSSKKNIGRVYTISLDNTVNLKLVIDFISYTNNVSIKINNISNDVTQINELLQDTKILGVSYTDFISGHQYDLSELEEFDNEKSPKNVKNLLYSVVNRKINLFAPNFEKEVI